MRVDIDGGATPPGLALVGRATSPNASGAVAVGGQSVLPSIGDVKAISRTAALISTMLALPEVESGRVSEVQVAISNDAYHVDSTAVADSVITSMLKPTLR